MSQLIAIFDVQLPFRLLIKRNEDSEINFKAQIDDFDVKLHLIPDGCKTKKVDEKYFTFSVSKIQISVARNEPLEPPTVSIKDSGTIDYTVQATYFEERLSAYQKVALTVLNRLISFFKFKLHNPLLHELSEEILLNPKWTNELDEEVGKGMQGDIVMAIPGFTSSAFGVRKFTANDDEELKRALYTSVIPELYEEILSDAQAAIFQGKLRRAILEMAIACEVATKQAFFKKLSVAGVAYEYPEDKRKILKLISSVAKEAFGESFKDINQEGYQNIDFLFRCRNKIAHRGEIIYRDDVGTVHTVDLGKIEKWWKSVEMLFDWLNKRQLQ